jgi:hypothetical protein
MERIPITFYQKDILQQSFGAHIYPVLTLSLNMEGIIPRCESQHELLQGIIAGGSLAFNALVKELKENDHVKLFKSLDHKMSEYYGWLWIWSWDGVIMSRSEELFKDLESCEKAAEGKAPGWDSYDGIGCPYPILCIETLHRESYNALDCTYPILT